MVAVMDFSHLYHKPHCIGVSRMLLLTFWISLNLFSQGLSQETADKTLYIEENDPAPVPVGSLTLSGQPSSGIVVVQAEEYSEIFDFQLNGDVTAKVELDREQTSVYRLVVLESDGSAHTVDIVVLDMNDNAPQFTEPTRNLSFSESVAVDKQLALLGSANDPDEGTNSTQRYEIIGGQGVFRLEEKPVGVNDLSVTLKLNATLDYETKKSYHFIVRAFDGPGRFGDLNVNVVVEDVNDVKPEFELSLYSATVPENATIGQLVLTVRADDIEKGAYGEVEYALSSSDSSADYRHFAVDSNSGDITVQHALDYLTNPFYRLRVVASNPDSAGQSSSAVVNIRVLDVNDQPPSIAVDYLYSGLLSENYAVPTNIIRLSVSDPDQPGGNFTVQISDTGGKFELSKRDQDTFFIVLSEGLDRETNDVYNITVTAWDNGTPPLSRTVAVEVRVADVNDNSPVFAESSYRLQTTELARIGSPIGNITASDADIGDNGLISYSLEPIPGGNSDWFTVHNTSGMVLTARDNIVCEPGSIPHFNIRATDHGTPSRSSPPVRVTVTIQDTNDNEPVFESSFYSATKSESDSTGTDVVQVVATDSNCGTNSEVTYSLDAGGVVPPPQFAINSQNGLITLAAKLDFEETRVHEFPVMATDEGGQVVSVNVKVSVTDANDNSPIFNPKSYAANVRLDNSVGDTLIVVEATDEDSGAMGNVSYFVTGGSGDGLFSIDQNSGAVKLAQSLPSSPADSYELIVSARDGLNLPALESANVTISVVRDPALAPRFAQPLYQLSIAENSGQNQLVGRVQAVVEEDASGIFYTKFSGDAYGYFSIDSSSGRITTTAVAADRERTPYVIVNVRAEKNGVFGNAQANITIADVNDNTPEFLSSGVPLLPVSEAAGLDVPLYTVQAVDKDSGVNGSVRYQLIVNPDQMFQIGITSGALSLKKSLDYENKKSHMLAVQASDNGTPRRTNTQNISIAVQDVNDNPPIFSPSQYDLSLSELDPMLTKFGSVEANDADSGANARIHYYIQENQTMFGIYPSTGELYNEVSFSQMEERSVFTLHVIAEDGGTQSRTATCTVNIRVTDENDNLPRFTKSVFKLEVEEGTLPGQEIGSVSANDIDSRENARLTFTLPSDVTAFRIDSNSGKIYVNSGIDRETKAFYEFEVHVSNPGTNSKSSVAVVMVTVTDLNDNAPRFNNVENGVIPALVYENKDNNTLIVQVTAVDADEGDSSRVSYSLMGEHMAQFAMDPSSGWLRARVTFDREVKSIYNVTVVARDYGSNPRSLSSTATIMVRVLDKNEPPTFPASYIHLQTPENIPLGTVVGRVLAQDGDQGENGRIHYTIHEDSSENVFDVNMTSGNIYSALPVDYEKTRYHWLIVQAVDSSLEDPQATNINVTITIVDVNDNRPTFTRDPKWISIVENSTVGKDIGDVTAHDADSGQNGQIIYVIVSQFPQQSEGMFAINPKTGEISTADHIDYEITTGVLLVIKATDQAVNESQRLYSTCSVIVNIEDINDNKPVFKSRNVIHIAEDEPQGYPVILVVAVDADKNNSIRYSITGGDPDNMFTLNRDTGELKLSGKLDREVVASYNLSVKAIDTGNPPNHDTQTIYITVTDINDNAPTFINDTYTASVMEEQGALQKVVTVQATDLDIGVNAQLVYIIPPGLADDVFTIDAEDGTIRTSISLNRENKSVYTFSAYVHDSAYPRLYGRCTVVVHVEDINDHTPYFTDREFFHTVPENLRDRNASIFQVVAYDHDTGDNAFITYSITMGNEANKFSIDPRTGKIYAQSLDREQQERYTLTIQAQDHGNPPRHNFTNLVITISDTNDNDPEFTNNGENYVASLNETISPGSFVLAIEATDRDKGNNSKITYYISSNGTDGTEGKFHLDTETGVITTSITSGHFDREKKSRYMFKVTAQDNAQYDPRTKQTWVEITILDVNDNAPVFSEVPIKKNITRLAPVEDTILTLEATDNDEPGTDNSRIEYSIVEPGAASMYFRVVPDTGEIKIKQSLMDLNGIKRLRVRATDMGTPRLYTEGFVEITIGSSSGHQALKFTSLPGTLPLDEDVDNGYQVVRLTAERTDGNVDANITYSLSTDVVESNNPFSIDRQSGMIRVSESSKLNYEDTKRYRIVVVALSGDRYTDYCTVWINVQDKNDNAPVFSHDRNHGFVMESAIVSTYILQVQATDKDGTSPNNLIEYSLQGDKAHYLNIGQKTGIITLAQRVDRETNEQIRVTILARDRGTPSLTGSMTLRVTIKDANDNPPTFTNLLTHQADNPYVIKEDMQVGQQVYVVSALDPDTAPGVTFDFAESGNPGNTFSIDRYSGRITLGKELDHELVNSYILRIIANDSVFVVPGDLYIRVADENDNAPRFNESSYKARMEELRPPNTEVIQVKATDRDSGRNGRIKYSLQGAGADDFYINETTGMIYNSRQIQYGSNKAIINLAIKAADGGEPELNALVFVQIEIVDINNYAPLFSPSQSLSQSVSEYEEIGVTVLSLSASDADDSPVNKKIEFFIVGGDPLGMFSMENREANIGNIVLKKKLDRETVDSYQLLVMAADGGSPSKNTTTTVNITVRDFNDWPPVFSNRYLTIDPISRTPIIAANVSEDIATGSFIVKVEATDKDIGDNAVIEYMITSGNDDGLFQIDQQSGNISLADGKILDYDTEQHHRMLVRAADTGVPRQSAIATVLVNVMDVNDNKPKFIRLMYLEKVKEKQPYGTPVFVAQAVDGDAGIHGVLTYALHGADAPNFNIDPQTGNVTTAIEFSFAGKKTYSFNVSASDMEGARDVVRARVEVVRYDVSPPVFTHSSYRFEFVLSESYVGMVVGTVKATDADAGTHGVIVYTLLTPSDFFNLSRTDGVIAIKTSLTEEPSKTKRDLSKRTLNSEEILSIQASSGKEDSQSSVAEVKIVIDGLGVSSDATTSRGPSTTDLIIIIVVVCLAVIILIVILVVKTMRNRRNQKQDPTSGLTQPDNMDSMGRNDTYNRVIPTGMAPPPYGAYPPYGTASHDMTDRSQCASSGRGSAEFDDEGDEEITAINTVPMHVHQRAKIMPDSGIQRDADTISEHSARDHQEYLARLGIDSKKIGGDKKAMSQSVESMHQFSDEGGGEADPLDISNIYNKLGDDAVDEAGGENNINQMGFGEAPAQIGSLSSVTDASEEFTGSYNWDYLLNWGPQFQPLADVFAEIARLKDETIQPKRKPVQTIPQSGSARGQQPLKLGGPPPIITATPPRVDSSNHREMAQLSSARTSQLTSMVSLPHSPISHESSFSNLAFSPNFTPALSPLATRSPSVSTLQSNGSRSRSMQGSRLGQGHMLVKPPSVSTDSDADFRI